jgi:hypothetical protein
MRLVVPLIVFRMRDNDRYNETATYARGVLTCDEMRAPAYRLEASGRQIMDDYLGQLNLVAPNPTSDLG